MKRIIGGFLDKTFFSVIAFSTLQIIFFFFILQKGTEKSMIQNDLLKVLYYPSGKRWTPRGY